MSVIFANSFIGALVERRILICGLAMGAFVLAFAFFSWREGLWRSEAAPSTHAAAQPHEAAATPIGEGAPAAAAMISPPIAPSEPTQSEPYSAPVVESGVMPARRDRGAEHGSRTR
jgi:hypothetical protein